MTKILLVGEHPEGFTGNSHMLSELLKHVDFEKFDVSVFAATSSGRQLNSFTKRSYNLIEGGLASEDPWGHNQLLGTIQESKPNIIMFVGVDIWRYVPIYQHLSILKSQLGFVWVSLFPYDFTYYRKEWEDWLKPIDYPLVYSEYGLCVLKSVSNKVRYFRPPLCDANLFVPQSKEERAEKRKKLLDMIDKDTFLFGFFGVNQVRKDPLRLIKAFFELKKRIPNIALYLHTEMNGVYNLEDYIHSQGSKAGDVFVKKQGAMCTTNALVDLYNVCDCIVNVSLQEGLSWTLLEAMLCKVPLIAAYNTSQMELIDDGAAQPLLCADMAFIPISLPNGLIHLEARTCDFNNLVDSMELICKEEIYREELIEKGYAKANKWLDGVSNINDLFTEISKDLAEKSSITLTQKQKKVLFIQHSSAGDVLMSTQCFKGLKERHKWPLVYMTQPQYQDIVKGNPYIDEIIDYDLNLAKKYFIVYNPHGEKILPGGWNNLDVTLYSMYPYFCNVKADDMFIECVKPTDIDLPEKYIVVHSTGGSIEYRSYAHMNTVVEKMPYPVIQIGGTTDRKVSGCTDLRGKLSFRETAYVMKHAEAAVTIDSFPAHLAGVLGTPVVVLFGPAPARVTQPKGDKSKIICLEPNMLDVCNILHHCWSTPPEGKIKCTSPCINTISPLLIIESVNKLLKEKEAEEIRKEIETQQKEDLESAHSEILKGLK